MTVDAKLPNGDIIPQGAEWGVDIERMGQVNNFQIVQNGIRNLSELMVKFSVSKKCLGRKSVQV